MRYSWCLIAVLPLLTGCAGSIVGDAIAGPEKIAQQDDAYCLGIGARFGSPEYQNCRLMQQQTREARHASGRRMIAAGAAIAATPPPTNNTTCQAVGTLVTCHSY